MSNQRNNNNTGGNSNRKVIPIKINKITTNSSPSDEWTIQRGSKRNFSTSSNPTSPKSPCTKVHKKLFSSSNRFESLSQTSKLGDNPNVGSDAYLDTNANRDDKAMDSQMINPPPPIIVRRVEDFPELCKSLIGKIGVENFVCKSLTDRLKIQTSTPDAYRSLIHFLKDEKAEYHTYQLQQNKPIRVVIKNLHPTTPVSLIKSELEILQFEVRSVR
ncbi:Uncharacterized protein FWK35_00009506 [Aphis craccivora]|uniref:Nucleic-acid-binding protein n=1 Tax=Aphis craccivora TaxID=307492 RepID=A0A6G0ZHY9_APHCR|nr:Uncharacterized protein FWK35_00009506 [Aphis craccivora]